MKRPIALLIIIAIAAALTGCGKSASAPTPASEPETVQLRKFSGYVFEAFDTVITVTAYCTDQAEFDALIASAQDELMRCHRLFDIYFTYPDGANLRTINENAGIAPVKTDDTVIDLLEFAKEMYALTDGRVNVAMGSVLSLWHTAREYNNAVGEAMAYLPDRDELRRAAEHCDINDLIIDPEAGTVYLADGEMSLDVGAIAKGYATERAVQRLAAEGHRCFVINAGGNVRCCGTKPDGKDWAVAVTNPGLPGHGESIGTVRVPGGSIVTSGAYQRFFSYEGRRYHHIIDKDTLFPEDRYLSVTVTTENSGYADALSTALFNMDAEEALAFAEGLDGVEAMLVLADGSEKFTDGFLANFQPDN